MIFWLLDILDLGGTKISAPIWNFWYQKTPNNPHFVIPPPLTPLARTLWNVENMKKVIGSKKYVHIKIQCNLNFNDIFVNYKPFLTKLCWVFWPIWQKKIISLTLAEYICRKGFYKKTCQSKTMWVLIKLKQYLSSIFDGINYIGISMGARCCIILFINCVDLFFTPLQTCYFEINVYMCFFIE